jgi:hypothetical protein
MCWGTSVDSDTTSERQADAKRPDSALKADLGRTLSECPEIGPLPSVTCQELLELGEGHVLRDETPTATGEAFLCPVADDAPTPGYRLDVAPAAALLAGRLNGDC